MQQSEKSLKIKKQNKNPGCRGFYRKEKTLLQQGAPSTRTGLVNTAKALFHHAPKAGKFAPGHSQRQPLCLFLWRSSTQHTTVLSQAAGVKDCPYAHQRTRSIGVTELASTPVCISREGTTHAFPLFCKNKYFQVPA